MVLCTKARTIRDEGFRDSEYCQESHAWTGKSSFFTMAKGARLQMARRLERHMSRCLECGR